MDLPSEKIVTMIRGTAGTGTAGFGAIQVAGDWNSNDINVVWATEIAYASANVPGGTSAGSVTGYPDARFPYPNTARRQHRAVVTALRVRYIGTELNRGGRLAMLAMNIVPTTGVLTFATIASDPSSVVFPVDRKWRTIVWNPAYPEPYSYSLPNNGLGLISVSNVRLLACFEGVAAQNAFEWEVVCYHELVSSGATLPVSAPTKSHTDTAGYGFVKDFLSSETTRNVGEAAWKTFTAYMASPAAYRTMSFVSGSRPRVEF